MVVGIGGVRSRTVPAQRLAAAVSRFVMSSASWTLRSRRRLTTRTCRSRSSTTSSSFQTSAVTRLRHRREPVSATLHRVRRPGPSTAGLRLAYWFVQPLTDTSSASEMSVNSEIFRLLPHDAMHKRGLCRNAVSFCLSVRLSRSWILSKRVIVASDFFHRRVVKPF